MKSVIRRCERSRRCLEGGVSDTIIGSGAWEYLVIVFEPGQTDPLVVGAKRRAGVAIDWNVWPATATQPTAVPTIDVSRLTPVAAPVTARGLALSVIRQYALVRDAAMSQDGNQVSLVLVVDYAIDPDYARQLGDNFVRLAKSFLDDDPPGKAIGRGKYDYLIGIYYPNEKQLALGAKSRVSDRISW